MSMTMRAAARELAILPDSLSTGEISAKAASALLRGARGNSGVILSLIFRGFSKALKDLDEIDAAALAKALEEGTKSAYSAVMKPTEGTILTVIRESGEEAAKLAKGKIDAVELWEKACIAAKARGIKISCDLNYRGKLWTREEARAAMTELCQYVDVCISNEEDAKDVFGIEAENTDIYGGKLNHEGYKSVAKQLADKFGFEKVAITLRTSISASDNDWAGMLYDGENYCFSKSYHLHIVDRVGGGDSFGGGLIYALLAGKDTQAAIEFAVAASALKHSVEGDYNRVSVAEVEKLAGGDGSGRVQR
jgi:hypothetical protein